MSNIAYCVLHIAKHRARRSRKAAARFLRRRFSEGRERTGEEGEEGTRYLYMLMSPRCTMKHVQKRQKAHDRYGIAGATARHPQNKIKRIYSFADVAGGGGGGKGTATPSENGPITSAGRRVILRSTFTNDPTYRRGSLRGR